MASPQYGAPAFLGPERECLLTCHYPPAVWRLAQCLSDPIEIDVHYYGAKSCTGKACGKECADQRRDGWFTEGLRT